MALTEIQKLRLFLKPYYQEDCDAILLQALLDDKQFAECAAAFLWGVKAGELSQQFEGIKSQANGSESVSYQSTKEAMDGAMRMQGYYYQKCLERKGGGTGALMRVKKPSVIGINQDQSEWDN